MERQTLNHEQFFAVVDKTLCREFDPHITLKQMFGGNPLIALKWGMSPDVKGYKKQAMLLQVDTNSFTGIVSITLNAMDLYNVQFFNFDVESKKLYEDKDLNLHDIYADQLTVVINEKLMA